MLSPGGPPKAASGSASRSQGPSGAEGAAAAAVPAVRLPAVQPALEYSTVRFSRQQPSTRLRSWDSRRASPPSLSLASTVGSGFGLGGASALPPAPSSARSSRPPPSRALGPAQGRGKGSAYPLSARGPRTAGSQLAEAGLGLLSQGPRGGSLRLGSLGSEAFTLDQQELDGFRLGGSRVPARRSPAEAARGPPGRSEPEEEDAKQVDQTPAHLVNIRKLYEAPGRRSAEGGEEDDSASAQGATDGALLPYQETFNQPETSAAWGFEADDKVPLLGTADAEEPEDLDEDTARRRELEKMKTGEDVIAYFAKNGTNTTIKFVYCCRRQTDSSLEFRPYDLDVMHDMMESSNAPPSKLGEHFTISNTGVVYVCPGRQSEYMSLGDWMRHCLMYSVLTSMNFFKLYLHRKVMEQWRANARHAVYVKERRQLSRRLFLAKPLFVGPLMRLHAAKSDMELVKVMGIQPKVYEIDEFQKEQQQAWSNTSSGASVEFQKLHDSVTDVINRLVNSVRQVTEDSDQVDEKAKLRPRLKSMMAEKKEARDNKHRQHVAEHDQGMLGDCVRLVDYMFQASLVQVVINASQEFFRRLETSREGSNKNKMFSISVSFGEKDMVLEPSRQQFEEMLTAVWRGTVHVVNNVPSFRVRALDTHVTTRNQQTVESILMSNRHFNYFQSEIRDRVFSDIKAAQRLANDQFRQYRKIHDYGRTWNEDEYVSRGRQQEELILDMSLMKEFQELVDVIRPNAPVGSILLDNKQLKSSLVPVPERGLSTMKKALIDIAAKKCREAEAKYGKANKELDERPTKLNAFAEYVRQCNEIREQMTDMEDTKDEVDSMYQQLKQYNMRVSGDDQTALETLHYKAREFNEKKMMESVAFIKDKREGMVDTLFKVSMNIEDESRELGFQLKKGQFISEEAISASDSVLEELGKLEQVLLALEEKANTFSEYQKLFGQPGTVEFPEVESTKKLLADKLKLWNLVHEWTETKNNWTKNEIAKLNVDQMNKQVTEYAKTAFQLTRSLPNDEVATAVKKMIDEWKVDMPCIMDLGNPAIQERHRLKIKQAINMQAQSFTLFSLMKSKVFQHKEAIAEISGTASGELALEQQLEKIEKSWEDLPLPVMNHRNNRQLWILADVGDIITQLEDHTVQIQTMMGSRYVTDIRESVERWGEEIRLASDIIDEWLQVQRSWMYLESIFSAEDIQRQLPQESTKFKGVDKFWRDALKKVRQSCRTAMDAFKISNLLRDLRNANDTLEQIQKSLEAYLETKRAAFPRFYFLSDDELLSILSQTRNPEAVQEHLGKCFDAISRVTFEADKKGGKVNIVDMSDMLKERVPFVAPVQTAGLPVEKWLGDIETNMVETLRAVTRTSWQAYPEDGAARKEWLFGDFPSQTVLAVDQIMWTKCAEDALNLVEGGDEQAMRGNIAFTRRQLEDSVKIVRLDLTKLQRVMMGALIVLDVHGISVLENLQEAKCRSTNDFDWSKQLRYYWVLEDTRLSDGRSTTDDCVVKQTIAAMRYSFEYLGNTPRLVVTPLTDKCYMTLTGAMHLNYGGAPAGPAGTGKTETTKDLGKALAVPVVVFNCSDGLDYKIMGRFFSGLAQAGAWACFDEFNRIQVEVLSVIAQQMLTVTHAIRARKEQFEFVGREIPLNPRFGVFITMNPGYAGRAELPDNLKSLFRPVAMMVPNYELIAEILLYSESFGNATQLARKMVNLYTLSSEQLSKQDHYDFGMRAVKSVLVMAGQLKRKYPDLPEDVTLIRALRDSNVPKFLSFDLPLFFGIITDLYPEAEVPYVDYGDLQTEIENQLRLAHLQVVPAFVGKIIQLLETQLVRHGVMVVGDSQIGKSANITTLSKALTQLRKDGSSDPAHQLTKLFSLNPKSITMEELYGSFNMNTGEWTDGLVAILVREAVSDTTENKKWVVFDGPVDAIWIENMNTVLDDNKMLCLANGERIKLPPTMTMLFEVGDLKVASPATVSRCGMVFLEPVHLGWKPLITSWGERFKARQPLYADTLRKWCLDICEAALPFIREECKEAPGIPSTDSNLVTSFLRMLECFVSSRYGFPPEGAAEGAGAQKDKQLVALSRMYCVFCAVWSLGGNLHESSRQKFQDFLRGKVEKFCPETPQSADLYSVCVDHDRSAFVPITEAVPAFEFVAGVPFFNILVPTVETTLQRLLLESLMHGGFNTLFTGETGVGKSVGIQQFLNSAGESFAVASANFSAQTSSANIVDFLENRLERKRKNLLGAPPGTKMLLFVDDVNMPMLEKYGAQPPIELLRQVVDYRGFYDRKKLFWKAVADTQLIAACGPPGGGRMVVTPRFFRHFNMIWMTALPKDTMNRILSSILTGWLNVNCPSVKQFASPIVGATVDMFYAIVSDLLPTPLKCHYTFNLRDPAKMIQGMLMVFVENSLRDKKGLVKLWLHETCRSFRDRLVSHEDRGWFDDQLMEHMEAHLGERWQASEFTDLVYGDFFDRGQKIYIEAESDKQVLHTFGDYLEEYNSVNPSKMNLVFFKDAQAHLARAARVVRQPRGNALLVGVSGVGRKSIARMAAHMAEYACSSIEITRNYGTNEFRDDIKGMMMAIVKNSGKGMMFLFSDTQIVKESFLEDINNVLNTGEVPNLFLPDEVEQVIGLTRPLAKAAGKVDARDEIWQHFVQIIRESFHIVLAFSPVGEGFRARCRQFPSLINCATIDWYDPWPEDALVSVADRYYREAPKELGIEKMLGQLSQISCTIHASSSEAAASFSEKLRRKTYMTPTSYLELIKIFTELLGLKMGELNTKLNRYKVGAAKLEYAKKIVDQLQVDLTKLAPEIEQGKKDTAELIIQVDKEEAQAKEKEASCKVDEKEAGDAAAAANEIKADCQKELDEALPEYYAALKSLDTLDKKDINEVKSFKTPPDVVVLVLSAVCLLMGRKESWDEAKKLMNESSFLQQLREYDKDALSGNTKLTGKMQKYVKNEQFVPEVVQRVSTAAYSLCMWVRAMDTYARVARSIEPKKAKLKSAEDTLAEAEKKLSVKKKELQLVQDKVAALQQQLKLAKSKAEQLEAQAEDCKVKLTRAEKLLAGLGTESVRWAVNSKELEQSLKSIVGNITLAAGFIAYAGPFTAEYRHELTQQWLHRAQEIQLDTDPHWEIAKVLLDQAEVRQWNIASLPSDELSVQNGVLVTRGRRWPLMIDPQGQGNRWIKSMKKDLNLGVIKLSTPNFLRTLELGIREGWPILLENVEEVLDPALEPVLLKQVFKKGGQWLLRLGSEDVPYSSDFQFFITTKMGNPHYLPEICIKVTVINFTVTLAGLEDQLVADVVANERPDLSELRASLVVQIAADKAEMDNLEQLTLKLLAETKDDKLLADDSLIQTLEKSKVTGASCEQRMESAEVSMKEINGVTEKLRPVAARASIIYFVVADLASIDPMYQYSLQFFGGLFQQKLQSSEKSDNIDTRIRILLDDFTEFAYVKICMGLFEDHKLLFSFLVTARILRHQVHAGFLKKRPVSQDEWAFFLRGAEAGQGIVRAIEQDPPCPTWMDKKAWRKLCVLEELTVAGGSEAFKGLTSEVAASTAWQQFVTKCDAMHEDALPEGWEGQLTPFQRLLLVKSLRENSLQLCVRRFVGQELGSLYTVSPAFDLLSCFRDSQKTTPLIFVLSSGADPTDALVKFARDFEYEERLHFISLGQGQGGKAESLIKHGRESGDWVCLQNCHLAASWMPALERIQEQQDADAIDDMYRLWLTAMPSPTFPVPVLQNGIKITNEPPKGLRANLSRTFQDITPEVYEGCSKSREFKKLLFGLAFFHAAILERRKFGPIGWNVPYEWMDSDFQVSREQVQMYLESQPGVPWITLTYIIAEVNYGGRVTDDKDVRLISAFLTRYFNEGLLEDGYKLSPLDAYTAPPEGSVEEVRRFVASFPLDEDPQVFGLHSNAQITAQSEEAKRFLDTVVSVQPRASSGGVGKSPEELVAEMADGFFARAPELLQRRDAHPETYAKTASGGIVSQGVFHGQELDRFNALIARVKSTLVSLGKAIKGLVVMSAELEEMYGCFLVQKLPPLWGEPISYPCLKPLNSWFADFEARVAFMHDWLVQGPPPSFWLPCFFFPQGFMTCSKQVHARKTKIPIDQLAFFSEPTALRGRPAGGSGAAPAAPPPESGVNVHGLFLQGAGWSEAESGMCESEKAVLFAELPVIWLKVVMQDEFAGLQKARGRYSCPLYKTSLRRGTLSTTGHSTNFVTYFQLPSREEDQGHWVRRGAALLCMLDD